MEYQNIELILGNAKCRLTLDASAERPSASPPHAHTSFELFYVRKGSVEIKTDEQSRLIGKGQAILIAPACYHQSFTRPDTEKINVYFSFVRTAKRTGGEDAYAELVRVFSGIETAMICEAEEIGTRLLKIREYWECESFGREERLSAELTGLVFALYDSLVKQTDAKAVAGAKSAAGMQYRYEIDELLSHNYAKDIDLDFLAKSLYLSPKRVAVLIKALYGKSFRQVKAEMKIQVAKQMLKDSDLTVAEIAEKVGYKSTRGFLAAFEQMTGKTPSEYRDKRA